ncbi:UHRF1-binding protein 1-like, partial [Operophtera brumata]
MCVPGAATSRARRDTDSALTRDDARSDAASTASSDSERYVVVGLAAESPDDADMAFSCLKLVVKAPAQMTWRERGVKRVAGALNKFSMRARAWTEPDVDEYDELTAREASNVAARLLRTELPRKLDEKGEPTGLAPFEELLEARIRDLSLALNMSTALALAELVEDEVLIENVKLHLIEDRQTHSISSPPPQPLNVSLTSLRMTRDSSGVLHFGPPMSTPSTVTSPCTPQPIPELDEAREKIDRLHSENEELRR